MEKQVAEEEAEEKAESAPKFSFAFTTGRLHFDPREMTGFDSVGAGAAKAGTVGPERPPDNDKELPKIPLRVADLEVRSPLG